MSDKLDSPPSMYYVCLTLIRGGCTSLLHTGVVSMSHVFVGASAFKYAKDLVAWNISKVSSASCVYVPSLFFDPCVYVPIFNNMDQMLGGDDSFVWNTLTSCDKKTLWNAWYDIVV